ncbi:two-component response regulator ORR24 [Amborella trichopoda]|uniref:Response regulatory domain-containing protein n=1 Tax=Amborella trichopoda TaxID=13333 RepID=W1PBK0_AMBTC|nr:two-component response regulator ORR24 [Amborella trichopoda]XP_020523763.1 two-component response regulator ORR24 [Amborella trichopoda]XP_020523765.1 two-component response regulator ORR24 [Amborella trichopoda]ERN07282.1 hypothetical protein AMTR_s00019p00208460 [Amborella trichopoda]|eukprot:XP_006845607.1 two-component response regulator ORR24 [Amborella trichopoda]
MLPESGRESGRESDFPAGLRVLAVDDDPTCLKLLEGLLRRCEYKVTITGHAITALKLLREKKGEFDLVISDVHMPDMDGFKLLELVKMEMNLPVIMVSVNGDTNAVMKGINCGARDYLLKPVRFEVLKNIWQHVIRKGKIAHGDSNNHGDDDNRRNCGMDDSKGTSTINEIGSTKKHTDQNEREGDEGDDHDSEDPSALKRPRVIWTSELRQKFEAAVHHLGIEKAVPKKILDLMNVPWLTRENVASHLQKYRLSLKKRGSIQSHLYDMYSPLRGHGSSYFSLDSNGGFGGKRHNGALISFDAQNSLDRFNGCRGFGTDGFNPSRIIQFNCSQDMRSFGSYIRRPQRIPFPINQHDNGFPAIIELNKLQQMQDLPEFGDSNISIGSTVYVQQPLASISNFSGDTFTSNSCCIPDLLTTPFMGNAQQQVEYDGLQGNSDKNIAFYDSCDSMQSGLLLIGSAPSQQSAGASVIGLDSSLIEAGSSMLLSGFRDNDGFLPEESFESHKENSGAIISRSIDSFLPSHESVPPLGQSNLGACRASLDREITLLPNEGVSMFSKPGTGDPVMESNHMDLTNKFAGPSRLQSVLYPSDGGNSSNVLLGMMQPEYSDKIFDDVSYPPGACV